MILGSWDLLSALTLLFQIWINHQRFKHKAPVPLGRIFFPIVHDSDKFSNREQSETNQNDENAMCDYLSEYLRMCFRLYED